MNKHRYSKYERPKHSQIMANAHGRLLNDAVKALRVVDQDDKPVAYVEEAHRRKRDVAPGYRR